jgi:hypothetical protein
MGCPIRRGLSKYRVKVPTRAKLATGLFAGFEINRLYALFLGKRFLKSSQFKLKETVFLETVVMFLRDVESNFGFFSSLVSTPLEGVLESRGERATQKTHTQPSPHLTVRSRANGSPTKPPATPRKPAPKNYRRRTRKMQSLLARRRAVGFLRFEGDNSAPGSDEAAQ